MRSCKKHFFKQNKAEIKESNRKQQKTNIKKAEITKTTKTKENNKKQQKS